MHYSIIGVLLTTALLTACQNSPHRGKDEAPVPGNLVKIDSTPADLAYVDPKADFSKFTSILLTPLGVDNVEIIQPQAGISAVGIRDWQLTETDKQRLQREYQETMVEQLSRKGGYSIVNSSADKALQISAKLIRISPTAPKDDNHSRQPGRNRVFTEGVGKLRIEVTFSDSATGEVLALTRDTRSGSSVWGINNSVTNAAEVRRVFNAWAMQVRLQLDRVNQKGKMAGQE